MYRKTFLSHYTQYSERNGQEFSVLRRANKKENPDKSEVGEMFLICFNDGKKVLAWPEEVVKDSCFCH